jgi:hypothetical protein
MRLERQRLAALHVGAKAGQKNHARGFSLAPAVGNCPTGPAC